MNIIFKENLPEDYNKYTILELDTFVLADGTKHTACCVVENIPITELSQVDNHKDLHAKLIKHYADKNWDFCEQAIEQLTGKWGNELDSFYAEFGARIQQLKTQTLPDDWSPVIQK
jgi:hypothetical protein